MDDFAPLPLPRVCRCRRLLLTLLPLTPAAGAATPAPTWCRLNIRGVPYFIISNPEAASGRTYALSGAQPAAAFEQTMRRALSEGSNCR